MDVEAAGKAVTTAEREARKTRGLPPAHILEWSEFPFAFATREIEAFCAACTDWARAEPANAWAVFHRAVVALAHKDYPAAEAAMDEVRRLRPDHPMSNMRFGSLPMPAPIELPAVIGAYPKSHALFMGCSGDYLREFGVPLLRSIAHRGPGMPVHVHLMGDNPGMLTSLQNLRLPLRLTHTFENPSAFLAAHNLNPRDYYCLTRLLRFADAVTESDGPLWLSDLDGLFQRDAHALFDIPGDFAIQVLPGRIYPWQQFSACLVKGSPGAASYFRAVSDILRSSILNNVWGFDQYALFSAFLARPPAITLLSPEIVEVATREANSLAWYTAGYTKLELLKEATPYAELYRQYRNQAALP